MKTSLGIRIIAASNLLLAFSPMPMMAEVTADMQPIDGFVIDRTEVTIGQFARFVAATGTVKKAERNGGGLLNY